MKSIPVNKIWLILCFLCILISISSCIKDETVSNEIPVNIILNGRGDTSGTDSEDKEGIRTLRIVIAKSGMQSVIRNETCAYNTNGFWSKQINLIPGSYDFYIVANEAAIGFKNISSSEIDLTDLKNFILTSDADSYINGNGIPFGHIEKDVLITSDTKDLEEIKIDRALSKISLSFINETGVEQTIQNMKISGIKANKGFLFCHTDEASAQAKYSDLFFGDNGTVTVPSNANENSILHIVYIYPGKNPDINDCYYLTATWNGKQQNIPIENENFRGTYIPRNTHLEIIVRLKKDEGMCAEITCSVEEWESVPLNPSFE